MNWESRIRQMLAPAVPGDDVIEELGQHARAMYDAARAEGCSREEAEHRVSEQLARWRADARRLHHRPGRPPAVIPPAAASSSWLTAFGRDIMYAARLLRRQPRFTLVATLTMALGIGAATTLFAVVYGVLMKPLPWPEGQRLVLLKETRGGNRPRFGSFTSTAYVAWRGGAATLEGIAAWSQRTVTLSGAGDPDRIRVASTSASLFAVLQTRPVIGSLFAEQDERVDGSRVVLLSESLWRERFGADSAVLGRIVQLDGEPHTILGVLPDRTAFPDRRTRAWVPFRVPSASGNSLLMFEVIGRLKPGTSAAQAASEGTARGRLVADTGLTTTAIFGGNGPVGVTAVPLKDALTAEVRGPLEMLLAAVGLLLLTATVNVGGLQLARAATRRREMAIRSALGAGTGRVVRQLLAESALLGAIGGGAGIVLAWVLHGVVPTVLPADFPRADDLGFNVVVIVFGAGLTLLASMVFGVFPAVRLGTRDLVESLSEDGAVVTGVGSSHAGRARAAVIVCQVAIASLLLVGAALLGRSFLALLTADRGYDPSRLLTARISLPGSMYTPERRHLLIGGIVGRLATTPGITHAGFTSELPLTAGGSTAAFTLRHRGTIAAVQASPRIVSAQSFAALGMRISAGRGFSESDTDSSPPVAVVNRAFARRYLGDEAVGAKVPMGAGYQQDAAEATVVGVVDDVQYLAGPTLTQPEVYYSFGQFGGSLVVPVVTLLIRTSGDPLPFAAYVRDAVREADRALVAEAIMPMEDRMAIGLARPRLYSILLAGFACFALIVAAVGLFGVLSQTVVDRSREIAVRSALGARPSDIASSVLRQGLIVTAAGLIVGLGAAAALGPSMSSLLYGVTPYDRAAYIAVPVLLLVVATIACVFPALRAARIDPVRMLRN
jgi:predicted permease